MSSFVIEGGYKLSGEITPQGAKNEALEVICAVLLTSEKVTIHNIPDILDVNNLIQLLRDMNVKVEHPSADTYTFQADDIDLDYLKTDDFLRKSASLRGSVMIVGPLVARFGKAMIPKPGGDKIGRRRLDTHFVGIQKLGACFSYDAERQLYEIEACRLKGAEVIAKKYNCTFKNLLTGFKYIGELITNLESEGRASDFVMGFEESYGYLAGTHARDKDAVVGSMLICEMAAYYKTKNMNLVDVMNSLYEEFGFYANVVESYTFEGASGMEKMASIMDNLRANPPKEIAGMKVLSISDYKTSVINYADSDNTDRIDLPKSNVLEFSLVDSNKVIVRPSGTEPKIKAYVTAVGADRNSADALADKLVSSANEFMK